MPRGEAYISSMAGGARSGLRKGSGALTPRTTSTVVLHLMRIVPTKGSSLKGFHPQPYRSCGFFADKRQVFAEAIMQLIVNGAAEELADHASIADLLVARGHDAKAVVVERNGTIVPRDAFATTRLASGDRLEIVQFVGGG